MKKNTERWMKSYFKQKEEKKRDKLHSDEYDVTHRQAPLKTFQEVNVKTGKNHQYSWPKHRWVIQSKLPWKRADKLIEVVREVNSYTYTHTPN